MNTVQDAKKLLINSVISTSFIVCLPSSIGAVTIGLFEQQPFTFPMETANLIQALESGGHTITIFSGLDAPTWQAITDENQVIVIPSIEGDSLFQALPVPTRNVIENYVSNGGGFLSVGDEITAIELMNGLFGFSLFDNFIGGFVPLNTVNAEGTVFESGPSSLPPAFFISPLRLSSLPEGSISFYDHSNSEDATSVFSSPFGQGKVGYNGFNYSTDPQQAGGWSVATNNTIEFIAKQSVPESSSTLGIIFIGGLAASKFMSNFWEK